MTEKAKSASSAAFNTKEVQELAERIDITKSIYFYYDEETREDALKVAGIARKKGIQVITRDDLNFKLISDIGDRYELREKIGQFFIFPSELMLKADRETLSFLKEAAHSTKKGIVDAIFIYTNEKTVSLADRIHMGLPFQLSGKPKLFGEMEAPGMDVLENWLDKLKKVKLSG